MMFERIEILWYGYVIAGFCLGIYIHSQHTRHWLHWIVVKVLQGFIWILHRTDSLYREPKQPKIATVKQPKGQKDYSSKSGIPVDQDEVERWLRENPDLRVEQR